MVKNLFKNSAGILFRKQTNILSAAFVIALAYLVSKVVGLIRLRLMIGYYSIDEVGLFMASFRLPNTVFDLIVLGALTLAFIPVFTSYLNRDGKEAQKMASIILNFSCLSAFGIGIILAIFAEPVVRFITPGLTSSQVQNVVPLTRIMLLGQILPLVVGNFFTGIIQSNKRFLIPALAPVVYNFGIIAGIVFLSPTLGLYGAVWGVVLGAVLFMVIQIPLIIKLGFSYSFSFNFRNTGAKKVLALFVPRLFGLSVNQINYTALLALSSLFGARGITVFSLAQILAQTPVGMFAQTISQAALPTLAEEKEKADKLAAFKKTFFDSFYQILFLVLPVAAILIVLRIPVVRLVYGAPQFDWPTTVDTGRTLAFMGVGLIAESLTILLIRAFYALEDSKTPVLVGALASASGIGLATYLIVFQHQPIWMMAAALAVGDGLLVMILFVLLCRRLGEISFAQAVFPGLKMTVAAIITGISLYVPLKLLDQLVFDTTRVLPLMLLTGTATMIGLSVYLFLTWVFDINELQAFLALLARVRNILFAAEREVSEVVAETAPESNETHS